MNAPTNNIVLMADGDTAQLMFGDRKITIEASDEGKYKAFLVSCDGMGQLFALADETEPEYNGVVSAVHLYPLFTPE